MKPKFKDVEVFGRKFRIQKMTPQTGCQWAFRVLGDFVPSLLSAGGADGLNMESLLGLLREFTKMPDTDFNKLQQDCLSITFEKLEGGLAPVLDEVGQPGIHDGEGQLGPIMFSLTLQSFAFSMIDFFDPALLGDLGAQLGASSPKGGNNNSYSPQSSPDTGITMTYGTDATT